MLAPSGAEGLIVIVVLLMYALAALVFYWIIRLGVRHGTLDAYRRDRIDQRIAAMKADPDGPTAR
ncbi:hypothetical protein L2K70_08270 [Nocardioides KLBMP 9356]|uniref:CcmD family protein n=1 Tax=Nocardioides potassii TaxID=2911371 RepID=A0ABS9HBE5_9ACTN|nr:hypothetical protein [Nocardioides potassii]MCF6377596.1 hypothetical protein [Nocardioides potassii]